MRFDWSESDRKRGRNDSKGLFATNWTDVWEDQAETERAGTRPDRWSVPGRNVSEIEEEVIII